MNVTCRSAFRGVWSACAPITMVIGFSFLLTWLFILYQPSAGPGTMQKVGWQSWEAVTMPDLSQSPTPNNQTQPPSDSDSGSQDWWNVTQPEEAIDYSSFPLDVWTPLLPHDTGLSEIAVARCFVNPEWKEEFCAPKSTPEEDTTKGKWVRVRRNLNFEASITSGWLNVYYRRTRRRDIKLITDIKLLPENGHPNVTGDDGWYKANISLRTGIKLPPLYLWYRLGKTAADLLPTEHQNLITELDVLYGEDVPWYGFDKLEPATWPQSGKIEATWLTFRRGVKPLSEAPPKAPPLHFSHSGKFKILQVADLHYSVSRGRCRETEAPCNNSDSRTANLLSNALELEKPDLVIFTGDQLNGQGTSWDPKSVYAKFARAVTDKGIPWAAVFGNHEADDGWSKEDQMLYLKALPYSLTETGPKDVHGVGNYVLKVRSADSSKTHLLTLYFLDSGAYSKGYHDFWGFFYPTEYDWIRQSQIDWFLQESASIPSIERPFHPNQGHAWKARQQVIPNTRMAKPNALMFFHIPLQESYTKADSDPRTGKLLDMGISSQEKSGAAKSSDGFFEKGLLRALESDHVGTRNAPEVKVVGNGHCHVTENCRRVKGVWLCFGGGGSYSGYGKVGFDRRFRVYEIVDYGETIRTHKRTEHGEIIDEMVLAGTEAAPSIVYRH